MKSKWVSIVVPDPTAAPCTAATSGLSKLISASMRRCWGLSPGLGGFFRKSPRSLPAVNESPVPCTSTTRMPSSVSASLSTSAKAAYMLIVIAFFFAGRLNATPRMRPERSVMISASELIEPPAFLSARLHESAEPSYGFADDQVLYLVRAFVGIERFCIDEEPRNVVVENDAVPAEDLPSPRDRL